MMAAGTIDRRTRCGVFGRSWRRAATAALAACLVSFFSPAGVLAQDEPPDDQKTKQAGALSKPVYDKLTKAQEQVDAKDYAGALRTLGSLDQEDLSPYELANLLNFYGFVHYNEGNTQRAIQSYERLLTIPELEPQLGTQTLFTLAQLYATTENWQKTIEYLNRWFPVAPNPGPQPYILLAQAYYQLQQYNRMIEPVETAISVARERGTQIKEEWWQLLYFSYYQQEDYRKARDVLKTLLTSWPKKTYWTQLAGMYSELDEQPNFIAAYRAMETDGLLSTESEIVNLAQLLMQAEIPYWGAKVLAEGIESGVVEGSARNYRLLSQAYTLAQEDDKAIPALTQAARRSNDGELDARLAIAYLNLNRNRECVEAANEALRKGGLKSESDTQVTRGMCLYNLERYKDARRAFVIAGRSQSNKRVASQWVQVIDSEVERLEQLEEAIARARRSASRS